MHSSKIFFQYVFAAMFSLLAFALVAQLWHADLSLPLKYGGDGIANNVFIKTIIETGWNLNNPYLSAPGEYSLADYPMAEGAHYVLIKLIALFSANYAVVINIFYILTFPLSALTALFVLKRLGLSYPFALVASILFAMAPYHFYRNEGHLFLASYYVIPLATWLALLVAENKVFANEGNKSYKRWLCYGLLCILIGTSGIYYAFFALFFIFIAGILIFFKDKKISSVKPAILLILFISAGTIINLAPSIVYTVAHGVNHTAVQRSPVGAEIYGLKMVGMLSPVENDRVGFMAYIAQKYHQVSPIARNTENENIGMIASIGFLLLILMLLLKEKDFFTEKIYILSKLNIFAVLLATIDGFGAMLAYAILPQIRCYNRISIFIAFFSLVTFFYLLQKLSEKRSLVLIWTLCLFFLLLGIYNQTTRFDIWSVPQSVAKTSFQSDEHFVKRIEASLPNGSMIFQLPYVPFPESPPINNMPDYDHFRAYLHSNHLRWSYGATKGRETAAWQQKVSALPIPLLVKNIEEAGFSGIYINRTGYQDRAANIEDQLTKLLNSKPIISDDSNLIFYNLKPITEMESFAKPNAMEST